MSSLYSFFCNIEFDSSFKEYNSPRTFQEPMCVKLARKINATMEKIDGGICFNYQDDPSSKWKYRSVIRRNEKLYVDFAPSNMRGTKRNFDLNECLKTLKGYEGFFVGDIFAPNTDKSKKIVPVYRVYTIDLLKCDLHDGFLEFVRENNQA